MMMAPARRSTPTKALEIINNLMPLDIYLHQISLTAYNRHKDLYTLTWPGKHPTHKTRIGHLYFWKELNEKLLGQKEIMDSINYSKEETNYFINIDGIQGRQKPKLSQINIYTDGSYLIMKGKHTLLHTSSINLRHDASIFQAELTAIMAAANFLHENLESDMKYVKIFSDSQASLLALNKTTLKSKTVVRTHEELNKLGEKTRTLTLTWIKAHHGHDGNELADEYVKLGTIDSSNYEYSMTTKTEIKRIIEEKKAYYAGKQNGQQTNVDKQKNFYPQLSKKI